MIFPYQAKQEAICDVHANMTGYAQKEITTRFKERSECHPVTKTRSLVGTMNRARQQLCPKEPDSLRFEVNCFRSFFFAEQ